MQSNAKFCNFLAASLLVFGYSSALLAGPSVSGGVSPAPRAVVIQGPAAYKYGQVIAQTLAGVHLVQGRLEAVTQRAKFQSEGSFALCIEYKDHEDSLHGVKEFEAALNGLEQMEILTNGECR